MKYSKKHSLVILLLFAVLLVSIFLLFQKNSPVQTTDLISGYDWSHFAGASQTQKDIKISPLNRTILAINGSKELANPSVNLYGPAVQFNSNFKIEAGTNGLKNGDSIRVYGGVPIIYDEWRFEPPSIEVGVNGNNLKLRYWNGKKSTPIYVKEFKIKNGSVRNLVINNNGDSLRIEADGTFVASFNAHALIKQGKMRFGFSVASGNKELVISKLKITSKKGSLKVSSGLQNLATKSISSGRIKFGSAIALNPLLTDKKYRDLALNQFNIWTPENELKAQFIHPAQDTYSFTEADVLVDTALKNNIAIHGHALVFGEANPKWMRTASKIDKRQIIKDHITTVMTHYKGKINEWDVINEPLSDEDADYRNNGDGLRRHIWYEAMGKDYIAIALRTAKITDNEAKLYINDYGLESDGQRWDAMIKLIDTLQAQGVPLDGVGFEAHIHEHADRVDSAVLARHIQELAKRGLSVRISEIDVFGDDGEYKQAKDYSTALKTCLSQANCVAYSTWGITDKYGSTTNSESYPPDYGNDLLWDSSYNPKAAYKQIRAVLSTSQ